MKLITYILGVLLIVSCTQKEERVKGPIVEIVSQAGDYFQETPFLPAPLTHGLLINEMNDTLNVFILAQHTNLKDMEIVPLGAFKIEEGGVSTTFLLAYPYDHNLSSMPVMSFNDFVIRNHSAKVIIDTYYSNYKGLGKTRVEEWQNTHMAQKIVDDFLKERHEQ